MNYIIVYLEIEHLLNFLTQEEKGDFLDLLIEYGKNQKPINIENKKLANVFNFMKGRLDSQFEKARLKAETAKKNGMGGGRPKKDSKPNRNPKKPKETQSVIENNFEEFWQFYTPTTGKDGTFVPKGSKADASKAYDKAIKQFPHEKIMDCLKSYLTSRHKNSRYTKHASSWLNQSLKDNFEVEELVVIQSQPQPTKLTKDQQQDLINQQLEEEYAFNKNF